MLLSLVAVARASEGAAHEAVHLGELLPVWSGLPFVGILLSIALFPLFAPHFWHRHFGKVSAFWALLFAVPFAIAYGEPALHEILHIYLIDYLPFIILLWALFTVAGGLLVEGDIVGKPVSNLLMLLIGTAIASWIGTTGASMLMIRPVLRANSSRKNKVHVVIFFIFLVSNVGGALTPLGDPPLFLGFLHSVPFFWTMQLLPETLLVAGLALAVFFIMDSVLYKREAYSSTQKTLVAEAETSVRIRGVFNFVLLAGVVGSVLMSGVLHLGEVTVWGITLELQNLLRDFLLIMIGLISLKTTRVEIRQGNEFTWGPIQEVAILFAGIFMTIIPALAMLRAGSQGHLAFIINGVKAPWHYFWITGGLSSFLDNAPTYLTFFNTALGNFYPGMPEAQAVARLLTEHPIYLKAISCGAVFMGANTYIGNAPNFMVRSIAEEAGVKMPSFFGYMLYSLLVLIPLFVLTTLIFF
ncbi:MAG TPA: sodium:proton antiporter [bacterium]|nr:sodium:proton antiporter [bacterium]HPN35295.1 sodium:proton antiporter [bacterium]